VGKLIPDSRDMSFVLSVETKWSGSGDRRLHADTRPSLANVRKNLVSWCSGKRPNYWRCPVASTAEEVACRSRPASDPNHFVTSHSIVDPNDAIRGSQSRVMQLVDSGLYHSCSSAQGLARNHQRVIKTCVMHNTMMLHSSLIREWKSCDEPGLRTVR